MIDTVYDQKIMELRAIIQRENKRWVASEQTDYNALILREAAEDTLAALEDWENEGGA